MRALIEAYVAPLQVYPLMCSYSVAADFLQVLARGTRESRLVHCSILWPLRHEWLPCVTGAELRIPNRVGDSGCAFALSAGRPICITVTLLGWVDTVVRSHDRRGVGTNVG